MNQLKEIKSHELDSVYINHEDVEIVKALAKSLKFKYTFGIIATSIMLFPTLGATMTYLVPFKLSIEACILSTLSIFLLLLLIELIKTKKSLKGLIPKKAQYGILKEKSIITERTDNGDKKYYHMDIEFPMNNTMIREVKTALRIYHDTKVGDKVLVVSFDGKESYAMKSNSQ